MEWIKRIYYKHKIKKTGKQVNSIKYMQWEDVFLADTVNLIQDDYIVKMEYLIEKQAEYYRKYLRTIS